MTSPPPPRPWRQHIPAHLEQARRNYRLYGQLKAAGEFPERALTALFYTALHLIQVCLIDLAADARDYPHNHEQRESFIFRKLRHLSGDYDFLLTRCNDPRYHPQQPRPALAELEHYEAQQFARIVAEARQRGYPLQP